MERAPDSHKGDNGKVAVIGGSRYQHGAPILSALGAESSGADLIYICLPNCHQEVAKHASLNFQVHPFALDDIHKKDIKPILELLATMDSAVIGPGIARTQEHIDAMREIITSATCALVLDATALQPETLNDVKDKTTVLTPHLGELERMGIDQDDLLSAAQESGATLLLKDQIDHIASPDGTMEDVTGGNAGLTVGGTGDVLAGLIAGLLAQRMDPKDAAITGARVLKTAGQRLLPEKGFAYTAHDVVNEISGILRTM
jgi:hydroxyethylthiazole kinase-like uncharacterized protein yjeF